MRTKRERLVKNYIYNTLYQVLVLITPLITTPYISRVLGVTNIGIYQYSQSIANYFILIGSFGTALYGQREIAYLQSDSKKRSEAFWEIEIFRLVGTIFCALFYYFFFCTKGSHSEIYSILALEIIAAAFDISWFFMGLENFRIIVLRNIAIKFLGIFCVFLYVKGPRDLGVYTICATVPVLIGNLSLWFSVKKYLIKTELTLCALINGIKVRLKSILSLFLPQIAADVYLLFDKTLIGVFGTSIDQVGYYSQAQKIVRMILALVTSLGTVMLPAMSAYYADGDQKSIIKNIKIVFHFIYMLSFALLFGLCAIASRFVPLFFGGGYEPVIFLIIINSPILVIVATSNVIGRQYLLPTKQQRVYTVSILTGAVVNFVLNLILIHFWDAVGASIATVFAEASVTFVQCWSVRRQLPLKEYIAYAIRYCFFGTVMFFAVSGISSILPASGLWTLFLMIVFGVFVYAVELLVTKDPNIQMGLLLIRSQKK